MAEENTNKPAVAQQPTAVGQQPASNFRGNQQGGQRGNFRGGPQGQRGNFRGGNNRDRRPRRDENVEKKVWVPKTQLGKDVASGKISTMREVLLSGKKIMEVEITESLIPDLGTEFINVGQAKGKFGGGKRKPSKSTQKITMEGSTMSFTMIAVSGNRDGVVGLGFGKARETVPSREKAVRNAKLDLIVIRRGCGSWGASQSNTNSIPFAVTGKSGSVLIKLIPAPPGTGLVAEAEVKKMLELAGIKDIWSKCYGSTSNKTNLMKAAFNALKELQKVRLNPQMMEGRAIKDGEKSEFNL